MYSSLDKENSGQVGVAAPQQAIGVAPVGKTFQSSSIHSVQRKVFGDVNTRHLVTPLAKQPLQQKPKESLKAHRLLQHTPLVQQVSNLIIF